MIQEKALIWRILEIISASRQQRPGFTAESIPYYHCLTPIDPNRSK